MEGLRGRERTKAAGGSLGGERRHRLGRHLQSRIPVVYRIANDAGDVKQKKRPGTWAEQDTGASIQTTLTCRNRQRTKKVWE